MLAEMPISECVACPVNVEIFDSEFNLIMTGEVNPLEETINQELDIMIHQNSLIMESNGALIYHQPIIS